MSASKLQSWGHYPHAPQSSHPLAWRDAIEAELQRTSARFGTTLAFGNGRSYGDSCLCEGGTLLEWGAKTISSGLVDETRINPYMPLEVCSATGATAQW